MTLHDVRFGVLQKPRRLLERFLQQVRRLETETRRYTLSAVAVGIRSLGRRDAIDGVGGITRHIDRTRRPDPTPLKIQKAAAPRASADRLSTVKQALRQHLLLTRGGSIANKAPRACLCTSRRPSAPSAIPPAAQGPRRSPSARPVRRHRPQLLPTLRVPKWRPQVVITGGAAQRCSNLRLPAHGSLTCRRLRS